MINTIVHLADIQFRTFKRHLEFKAVSDTFFDHMKKLNPDRIVITGDIVHSRNQLTPELVDEVSTFLRQCAAVTKRLIIIPGNHDIVEQNKDRMDALVPLLRALNLSNIDYFIKSELIEDENVVWAVYNIYENNKMPDALPTKPFANKTYVGLYHGTIVGAKNNLGFEFQHGADLNTFDYCDLTLCGDIHMRQEFKTPSGHPVIMVGSFIQQDFAETVSKHGYCTITVNNGITYQFTDIENPVKQYTFLIKDIEDIYEEREVLINA